MITPSDRPASPQGLAAASPPGSAGLCPASAMAVARFAVGLAIAADGLLRLGPGLGFSIWIALVAVGAAALAWQTTGRLRGEAAVWLAVAVIFAAGCAWRAGDVRALDFLAAAGALALAAATTHDERLRLFRTRIRDLALAGFHIGQGVVAGPPQLAFGDLRAAGVSDGFPARLWRAGGVILIVVSLAFVFGALLRGADPVFASFIALPHLDVGAIVSHLVVIGIVSWGLAGVARSALLEPRSAPQFGIAHPRLGVPEVTAALGTPALLFAAFIAAQAGWLFGGEAFLRARTGLTAAEYARQGFFQTVWVVLLVIPLLIGTRAMLADDARALRRHTALALPLVGLSAAIVVSAFLRLRLYVHYYALSVDRFNALVILVWSGLVLVWLATTIMWKRERLFAGGAAVSALMVLAALNGISPDLVVARANLRRAASPATGQAPADLTYLAGLGGEAMPLVVDAILHPPVSVQDADRCAAAQRVLGRWGPAADLRERMEKPAAWRGWNAGEAAAVAAVDRHGAELLAISHTGCAPREGASDQR